MPKTILARILPCVLRKLPSTLPRGVPRSARTGDVAKRSIASAEDGKASAGGTTGAYHAGLERWQSGACRAAIYLASSCNAGAGLTTRR